ncbi:MAG: terminase family protein [Candidatus Lernaella stagnicola]|nr:terminase family protein [Candidatus Lernaella stagnicola]
MRAGKTHAAAREFLRRIYRDRVVKRGALHYWAAAPTYSIGKVQQRELFTALGGMSGVLLESYRRADRELRLRGGITVDFKTTERPETLVAEGLDGLWVDEAARVKAEAWLGGLRMRLTDRAGWAIFSTTPLGRNWFYRHLVEPALAGDADYSFHTWPTVANAAIQGMAEEVKKAKQRLPEPYFRREYEASFDAFVGQIYNDFSLRLHAVEDDLGPVVETRYGVDWGFRHPGVILVMQRCCGDERWCVAAEEVHRGVLVAGAGSRTWVSIAKRLVEQYGQGIFYCDPSAPGSIQAFRQAGLAARAANNDVLAGIQRVAGLLAPRDGHVGLVIHRRCTETIREMTSYRWDEHGTGEIPRKEDDHTCDALRYALHTTRHQPAFW